MKIKEVTKRLGNDFWAIYECEHCMHVTDEIVGYDDANFHENVIPNMKCPKCGLNRLGE